MKESLKERRMGEFMRLGDLGEFWEKREKFGVELRKQRRTDSAHKRRIRPASKDIQPRMDIELAPKAAQWKLEQDLRLLTD